MGASSLIRTAGTCSSSRRVCLGPRPCSWLDRGGRGRGKLDGERRRGTRNGGRADVVGEVCINSLEVIKVIHRLALRHHRHSTTSCQPTQRRKPLLSRCLLVLFTPSAAEFLRLLARHTAVDTPSIRRHPANPGEAAACRACTRYLTHTMQSIQHDLGASAVSSM